MPGVFHARAEVSKIENRISKILLLALAAAAIILGSALRIPSPSLRPLHGDEGLNTFKFRDLLEGPGYKYDPEEYHGPTLPYSTLPAVWLSGEHTFAHTTEATYRSVTVAYGIGVIALTLLMWRMIGPVAAVWAALLIAASPAMGFYSRYYIHEMLLVFFTSAALLAGWKYVDAVHTGRSGVRWAALLGACFALMHATKETGAIAGLATVIAAAVTWSTSRRDGTGTNKLLTVRVVAALLATELILTIILFSSFFTNWHGVLDSVLTYWHYLHRGTGGEPLHLHPWYWYLGLLTWRQNGGVAWSEAFIVGLAALGCALGLLGRGIDPRHRAIARFLAVYTLVMLVIYSLIPYKTPWSILSVLHAMTLTAGLAAASLLRARPRFIAVVVGALLLAGVANLAWQSYRANFIFHTDRRNPYVYAHPSHDMMNLIARVDAVAAFAPAHADLPITVVSTENYWPLPFYLRRFTHTGYPAVVPGDLDAAAIVIAGPAEYDEVAQRLGAGYHAERFGLRPGILFGLFIRDDLWQSFIKTR